MNKEELKTIALAAAKNIKTEQDLNEFTQALRKITIEATLNAELDEHLGYAKHEKTNANNSRNGFTSKTLITDDGQFEFYQSATEEEALLVLDQFGQHWDDKYPQISKSWCKHWGNLNTLFNYPPGIRKAIYTTNVIE